MITLINLVENSNYKTMELNKINLGTIIYYTENEVYRSTNVLMK